MDKIRVGMIGCGGHARHHMGLFLAMPEVEITCLVDPDPSQIDIAKQRFAELSSVRHEIEHKTMLSDVDAVCICTPHTQHYEQLNDVLDSRKHVLIEKPMVMSTKQAREIIKRLDMDNSIIAVVGYQRHYQGAYKYIRERIAQGVIGNIQFVSALQCQQWMKGTQGTWRQNPQLSGGGQVSDSGSHIIDALLWMTGLTASKVSAMIEKFDCEVDINSVISIEFHNNALGSLAIVGNAPQWSEDFALIGERGAFYNRNGKVEFIDDDGQASTIEQFPANSTPDHNFIQAILGNESNQSMAAGALPVIELTEAIWKSAENNGQMTEVKTH